jgi:hypothetical protein
VVELVVVAVPAAGVWLEPVAVCSLAPLVGGGVV